MHNFVCSPSRDKQMKSATRLHYKIASLLIIEANKAKLLWKVRSNENGYVALLA